MIEKENVAVEYHEAVDEHIDYFEDLHTSVPKGKLAYIKAHAETQGESLSRFINRAIDSAMSQDYSDRLLIQSYLGGL